MAASELWQRVTEYPRVARGFDSTDSWFPHFAVPALDADGEGVVFNRPALPEDVRGSFSAISELAAFVAFCLPCDPANPNLADALMRFAREIEDMARGLRHALEEGAR